jgi:hypothetical protein
MKARSLFVCTLMGWMSGPCESVPQNLAPRSGLLYVHSEEESVRRSHRNSELYWVPIGGRFYATTQRIGRVSHPRFPVVPKGTPALPMWQTDQPNPTLPAKGFPLAHGAQHRMVFEPQPDRGDWAFNHHAALGYFNGRFIAMWSSHPQGEDAPGQRVLYAVSTDGTNWSVPAEAFPPPSPIRDRGNAGFSLRPDRWVVVSNRCFAIAYLRGPGTGTYPIARELFANGSWGAPFTLHPRPDRKTLPAYMRDTEPYRDPDTAQAILSWYEDTATVSWWAQMEGLVPRAGIGGAHLIEPLTYRAGDGETLLLLRFHPRSGGGIRHNNRMYVSLRDGDGKWTLPYPTNIPDSPSRTEAISLPDGAILLVGNQIGTLDQGHYIPRDPLTVAISSDGYVFDRVYALRADAPIGYRIPNISGRTLGYGYCSSLVKDGWLYTLYSIGKEDMAITRVPLSALGLPDYSHYGIFSIRTTRRSSLQGRETKAFVE